LPFSRLKIKVKKPKGVNYPKDLNTIGDHIRAKRLDLGLLQKDVAKLIGVSEDCITFWENGRSKPQKRFYLLIIKFLNANIKDLFK